MYKIILTQKLAKHIKKIVLQSPVVAKKILPGQFVIIIIDEKGERIPLTVAQCNKQTGTITLIFQEVGKSTYQLGRLKVNNTISSVLGPLGKPTEIKKFGTVVTIGGGVGIAEVYPVTKALKEAGNFIISIIGAQTKELLILEQDLGKLSDELLITTDDGSYGRRGFVSDALKDLLQAKDINLVYAVGPVPMMRVVSELTRPFKVRTLVSLNPILVDATGMCGSCRVTIAGRTQFGCVDGPEFDGHLVDYTELEQRLSLFLEQEKKATDNFLHAN